MTVSPASGKTMSIDFSMKEGFMRQDVQTDKSGSASIIYDTKNSKMIILIPQKQMYMVQPFGQQGPAPQYQGSGAVPPPSASNGNGSSFVDTGEKETIQGYSCEKYHVTTPKETSDLWITNELGTFMGLYHGGGPFSRGNQGGQAPGEWENMLKMRGGFFPMRVIVHGDKGTTKMEVTSVEKESLPDSLFSVPEGWRDLSSMMGGMGAMMGGGGYPGSHP